MADEKTSKSESAAKKPAEGKPAAKAKAAKAKPPKVEDKPFPEFITQDYLPALEKALAGSNVADLKLSFNDNQVSGEWLSGQRQFTVYFPEGDINKQRAFSYATGGRAPSTIEPFLVDERRITLDLLVFGVVQRLNAQKWFGNN